MTLNEWVNQYGIAEPIRSLDGVYLHCLPDPKIRKALSECSDYAIAQEWPEGSVKLVPKPWTHPSWEAFAMFAVSADIGNPTLEHYEDWQPWWECWLDGYNARRNDDLLNNLEG